MFGMMMPTAAVCRLHQYASAWDKMAGVDFSSTMGDV